MRFLAPDLLWLLALVPLLWLAAGRVGRAPALLYPSAEPVRAFGRRRTARPGLLLLGLRTLVAVLLILALARPQQGLGASEIETSGIDIVLVIDVSGSMRALDFQLDGEQVSRLVAARSVVSEFVEARQGDRVGLVAFAGRPYLVSPLTLDHDWVMANLERLEIGLVEDGTAIGSAIAAATNRLRDRDAKSRIVILLTDGVNNAGKISPRTAAEAARALGLKVYTILAGTGGEVPVPVKDRFGRERIVTARVDVDEDTLEEVADLTGALFFSATDTDSLAEIYREIDAMEKTTARLEKFERYRDLHPWLVLAALVVLAAERLLAETRLRRLP
jgi:Ca-activated chloride channel family protein